MSNELARRIAVDISTDNATWVRLPNTHDVAPVDTPTYVDTTSYDTNGFVVSDITLHAWALNVKMNRLSVAGVFDPVQETLRACQYQFGTAASVYVRWYDRNGKPDGRSGLGLVEWNRSKTAVADIEEITVSIKGQGILSPIANPGNVIVPVVLSALPSGAAAGALVTVGGQYLTGATAVKFGAVSAATFSVISDSTISVVMPAGTAGSAPVTVVTPAGTSNALAYTRA